MPRLWSASYTIFNFKVVRKTLYHSMTFIFEFLNWVHSSHEGITHKEFTRMNPKYVIYKKAGTLSPIHIFCISIDFEHTIDCLTSHSCKWCVVAAIVVLAPLSVWWVSRETPGCLSCKWWWWCFWRWAAAAAVTAVSVNAITVKRHLYSY